MFLNYMQFCFANQASLRNPTDKSFNDQIIYWTNAVAAGLGLSQPELATLYDTTTDTHDSETRTRNMRTYAIAKGNFYSPTAFVNGVRLSVFPATADVWMQILTDTYNAQTH